LFDIDRFTPISTPEETVKIVRLLALREESVYLLNMKVISTSQLCARSVSATYENGILKPKGSIKTNVGGRERPGLGA
jgi:hypothetical protein